MKCTRCERLLPVKHFHLTCLLFYRHLKITLDSEKPIGNLRTTTKFTMTTSVDRERTGTRRSVSAGERKLKMQSIARLA